MLQMTNNLGDVYSDLLSPAPAGPQVTVNISQTGTALVTLTARMLSPTDASGNSVTSSPPVIYAMGFSVVGPNGNCAVLPDCVPAGDNTALINTFSGGSQLVGGSFDYQASATFVVTGLTPGTNMFTAKYACAEVGGTVVSAEYCELVGPTTIMVTPY